MRQTLQVSEHSSLPEAVVHLVDHYHLGQVRACYRRRWHRFLLWFFPIWFLCGLSVPIYFFYLAIWPGQDSFSWADVCVGFAELLFGVSTGIFEWMGIHPHRLRHASWYVADRGLLFVNGEQSEVVRWDEVQTLFWSNTRSISSLIRIDGSTFRELAPMDHAHEVSTIVADAVTERLLPEMLAQYQRIGKVRFGSLSVTSEGITNWGRFGPWAAVPLIPWHEIEDVRFVRGRLGVNMHGVWKQWSNGVLSSYEIPNPTACVALIRQILADQGCI